VISDAHEGIKAAIAKVLHATRQRCRVHFMRNALALAGRQGRRVVSAFIATAFAKMMLKRLGSNGEESPTSYARTDVVAAPRLGTRSCPMFEDLPGLRRSWLVGRRVSRRPQGNAKQMQHNLCGMPHHLSHQLMCWSTALDALEKGASARRRKERFWYSRASARANFPLTRGSYCAKQKFVYVCRRAAIRFFLVSFFLSKRRAKRSDTEQPLILD
jgi:hypothetical protein